MVTLLEHRVNNATLAYNRCKDSGSVWGQNYWKGVVTALLKKEKLN